MSEIREKSRQEFEQWATKRFGLFENTLRETWRESTQGYTFAAIQHHWESWQASAKINREAGRRDALEEQWISVAENGMPKLAGEYLIVESGDREASTADFLDDGTWRTVRSFGQACEERELYSVTHWQKPPEPPKAAAIRALK